jgi:hypothetical protein
VNLAKRTALEGGMSFSPRGHSMTESVRPWWPAGYSEYSGSSSMRRCFEPFTGLTSDVRRMRLWGVSRQGRCRVPSMTTFVTEPWAAAERAQPGPSSPRAASYQYIGGPRGCPGTSPQLHAPSQSNRLRVLSCAIQGTLDEDA